MDASCASFRRLASDRGVARVRLVAGDPASPFLEREVRSGSIGRTVGFEAPLVPFKASSGEPGGERGTSFTPKWRWRRMARVARVARGSRRRSARVTTACWTEETKKDAWCSQVPKERPCAARKRGRTSHYVPAAIVAWRVRASPPRPSDMRPCMEMQRTS